MLTHLHALRRQLSAAILAASVTLAFAQSGDKTGEEQPPLPPELQLPPSPPLKPDEALKTFRLQPGFRVELVAAEPLVEAPVAMQFDGDGRLWVVEMRGFMPNANGEGETAPLGRIAVLEDTNGDGRMDRRTTFLDGLVLPRAMALVRDGVLVAEPPRLFFCRDTNGDGRADEKVEIANDYATQNDPKLGPNSNPEHASNGLMSAMDNWMYSPYHGYRYRNDGGRWVRQETLSGRGQWGMTQDDFGRLVYNSNSDHLRGDLAPYDYLRRNTNYAAAGANVQFARDQSVWPVRVNPGINRGYQKGMLRDGKLAIFTAACGPVIYRGDQFPAEFRGNAFIAEPSGNLIRRSILSEQDGIITATNAYDHAEFLASTDERFRPVNLYNGPDGALYITDLYRGIIQHRIYLTSFLRRQALDRGLETPLDHGRIYRVVHAGKAPNSRPPHLGRARSADLVKTLSDASGWRRDTAQRLLVERADPGSVSKLRQLATSGPDPLGRLHALWTLEGMHKLDEATTLAALSDSHPKVRAAAIRLSEPFALRAGDGRPPAPLTALLQDNSAEVQWQLAFTLGEMRDDESLARIGTTNAAHPYIRDAVLSGLGGRELEFLQRLLADPSWQEARPGREALLQALVRSVLAQKDSGRIHRLLDLIAGESQTPAWRQVALLDGVLALNPPPPKGKPASPIKPIALTAEPSAFTALLRTERSEVKSRAERLPPLFTWPGKPGPATIAVTALTDDEQKRFDAGRDLYIVTCGACHQPHGNGQEGLAPPLTDSPWVTGSEQRLIRITLQGVRGPITVKGRTYELEMPSMAVLEDDQIAAVLTYVRRAWGHTATAINPAAIAKERAATATREEAWTELELLRIP